MIFVFSATMEEDWDAEPTPASLCIQTPLAHHLNGKSSKLSTDLCEILSVKGMRAYPHFSCWFVHACRIIAQTSVIFAKFCVWALCHVPPFDAVSECVCNRQKPRWTRNGTPMPTLVSVAIFRIVFSDHYRPMYRSIGRYSPVSAVVRLCLWNDVKFVSVGKRSRMSVTSRPHDSPRNSTGGGERHKIDAWKVATFDTSQQVVGGRTALLRAIAELLVTF